MVIPAHLCNGARVNDLFLFPGIRHRLLATLSAESKTESVFLSKHLRAIGHFPQAGFKAMWRKAVINWNQILVNEIDHSRQGPVKMKALL